MGLITKLVFKIEESAAQRNTDRILHCLQELAPSQVSALLDIGCADCVNTEKYVQQFPKRPRVEVIDNHPKAIEAARARGFIVHDLDLEQPLPLKESTYDVVVGNNVIEHILNLDSFCREVYRITKPDGIFIVSTENLSGSHNLLSLFLGYQPFGDYVSREVHVGNPLFPHDKKPIGDKAAIHFKLFAPRGLTELLRLHGWHVEKLTGAGYAPFFGPFTSLMQ